MTVDVVTLGCRLNIHESQIIRDNAERAGISDLTVVNTCAVTSEAVAKARQTIRRISRERGGKIVVTGCAAQTEPQTFAAMPEVALVLGNDDKMRGTSWTAAREAIETSGEKISVSDIMAVSAPAATPVESQEGRTRAFVQIQNGCDHRCTFCIIPFGRGNSRSIPIEDAVAQVRRLTGNGFREIILTGVDLTSYGENLPGTPKLGALVKRILRDVPELARLRLSSIDAAEADDDLRDAFATEARLMPHLHLSLQAGDDMILKRMKRRHSRAQAIAFCDDMRRLRPDIVFGADIIAGFPTETEDMFTRSLDLVDECGLTHLHVFPFSPRPGTPAARMPQLPHAVIKERAKRLRDKGHAALRRRLEGEIGHVRQVLAERGNIGRTAQFMPVRHGNNAAPGSLLDVRIAGHDGTHLIAA
jgi:threonylcarbamoyladenosine tRNA methylthiotransferase MtaB